MRLKLVLTGIMLTIGMHPGFCQEPGDSKAVNTPVASTEPGETTESKKIEELLHLDINKVELELAEAENQLSGRHPKTIQLRDRLELLNKQLVETKVDPQINSAIQADRLDAERGKLAIDADKPSPFSGEWRLDSIEPDTWEKEFVSDDPTIENFEQLKSQVWIRDGILNYRDEEPIDLGKSAVKISEDNWKISLPGESPGKCWARQFGTVLRLDFTGTGTDFVYEFWHISPDRKNVMQELIGLYSQLSASRAAGDVSKSMEIETSIARLNGKLEQLDALPKIDSLSAQAILAREKGGHSAARQFEIDAKVLADKLQQSTPTAAATDTKESTEQAVKRSGLEEIRDALLLAYDTSEAETAKLAKDYRSVLAKLPPIESSESAAETDRLAKLEIQLKRSVTREFETRRRLQDVRMQLAELDLTEVRAKHERREALAGQIIERRVADLISGEEPQWPDNAARKSENNATAKMGTGTSGGNGESNPFKPYLQPNENQADPELDGEWRMLDITGMGIIWHQEGLHLRTSLGKWALVSGSHENNFERRLGHVFSPSEIDLFRLNTPEAPPIYSGIYKVEGDKLTIAWAPSDGSAPRPMDFSGTTGTIQTFARIKSVPTFATPQELVDYVTKLNAEASEDEVATMDQMFDLVTDDEINRFAGLMLRTASMMQMAAGLGAAFGSSDGSDGNVERQQMAAFLQAVGRMNLIVNKYRHESPAPEALAAYQEIAGGLNLSMLFQAAQPTASVSADEYSQKLRLAAGVLNDPKAFLSEILKEIQTLETTQATPDEKASDSKAKPDWKLTVNGDTAFAIDQSAKPEASNTLNLTGMTPRMDMIKVGDSWKISSLIPDRIIIEMQQGPQVSETSSPASAPPSMQPLYEPAPSAPAYAPSMSTYPTSVSETSAIASANLQPFTELTPKNVSASHVFANRDSRKAISAADVQGRYIDRPLESGQMITADMLIDKPTTQQIVAYWLDKAFAGENVFLTPPHYGPAAKFASSDDAARRPYRTESVKDLRPPIPDWTQNYLNELSTQLAEMSSDEWTLNTVNQIKSIQPLVQFNTSNSTLSFGEIGKHLHGFLVAAADTQTVKFDGEVIAAAQSSALLGLAFRLNGSLPEEILDAVPANAVVQKKLQLLTTMLKNKADHRWIAQERRRLFGLLEEAPAQTLKIFITLKKIESADVLENWLFSMSSERAYNERHYQGATPGSPFPPIVDPLLVIGLADLINQRGVQNSESLAWFFYEHAEDQQARVFISNWYPNALLYNHISDIIEGNLTYREFVLASLVRIYSKTDSQLLKDSIANLAPAVPVMATKP